MQNEQINNQQQNSVSQLGQSTIQPPLPQPQSQGGTATGGQNTQVSPKVIKYLPVVNLVLGIASTVATSTLAIQAFAFLSVTTQDVYSSYTAIRILMYTGEITTLLYLLSLAALLIVIQKDYKRNGILHEKAFKFAIIGVVIYSISSIINLISSFWARKSTRQC